MVELNSGERQHKQLGQAMVEYALILVLLALAFGTALALTGPAIGNVFCNVVHNLGGEVASPSGGNCGNAAPTLIAGEPANFWATVTWVAANPQGETPFPTPIRRAPAGSGAVIPPTNTPSNTPTNTPTFTPTNTFTATNTFTPGPSPTNGDFAFSVPHVDQINKPEWWRLDTGDFMGYTDWGVQWYDNMTTSANAGGWLDISLAGSVNFDNALTKDINGIQYDWGAGVPSGSGITCCTTWGGEFVRTITVAQTATYKFTLDVNNFANVIINDVNGGNPIVYRTTSGTDVDTMVIPAGTHTLRIIYAQNGGTSRLHLNVERLSVNPDDQVVGVNSCTWGQSGDNNNPVSVSWMFDENPSSDTWPSGQTCYLELRGYVDLAAHADPVLSYWDIWDFVNASSSGFNAQLQVSRYVTDVNGFLRRDQLSWVTIASHTAGDRNYNWTRNQVDLAPYLASMTYTDPVSGNPVTRGTFRFVIGSGSPGSAPFRWYIDDIQLIDDPTPARTFTVGNEWNLDAPVQKNDFLFDGDSYDNPALTSSTGPRRWDLTSSHAHSGMGWDDSPSGNYQAIAGLSPASPTGTAQARIHFLELKYPIDLDPLTTPLQDAELDGGQPMLTFWHAFDIQPDASIRVQYTRDANDLVPDNWIDIPNQGVLIDYAVPTGASRTDLSMQPVEIYLANVPNYDSQPFRLRFALYVDGAATTFGDGWYIDDIRIERESNSPYFSYPFVDDAEDASFSNAVWDSIGGKWGRSTQKGGYGGSATAFADSPNSPSTLYDANDTQLLQLHYAIDLLHDTPENTTNTGNQPAVNPVLTFWHQRYLGGEVDFSVEVWTPLSGAWQTIWLYDSDTTAPSFNTQQAWERVEINLTTAVAGLYGTTWSAIQSNSDLNLEDDDIKIRFHFASGSAATADGVYVDNIRIGDASTDTHRLWPSGSGGDGEYLDNIEQPGGPTSWMGRWYTGGLWSTTGVAGYTRTGSLSLTDSTFGTYTDNTYSVLELIRTVDLTTASGGAPIMTFWTRYQIGSDDTFSVQIATEDASNTAQGYDKIGGWSAWTTQPMMVGVPAPGNVLTNTAVDTWLRGQVNLASFVGSRIRVRFVISVPNTTNQADGIYVDDVKFSYTTRQIGLNFVDDAQTTANWITEGTWGLGQNYFLGGSSTDFGLSSWIGTYFDCEQLKIGAESCSSPATYTRILTQNTDLVPPGDAPRNDEAKIGPEIVPSINFNWGSTGWPLNNTASPQPGLAGFFGFGDTFAARWTRTVTLQAGTTYRFYTVSDDGVSLRIDDVNGTNIPADPIAGDGSGIIIDNWTSHPPTLDYVTFSVTSATPITRVLTLEYYEDSAGAEIILNATSSRYSFTDSPNPPVGNTFNYAASVYPGNSSLMLNGFFDLTQNTPSTAALRYKMLYDLTANAWFYVEVSIDGGFTWTQISSQTLNNASRLPPAYDWLDRTVDLRPIATAPNNYIQPNVMIRFRLDTRTATALNGGTGDGVYIADIQVND